MQHSRHRKENDDIMGKQETTETTQQARSAEKTIPPINQVRANHQRKGRRHGGHWGPLSASSAYTHVQWPKAVSGSEAAEGATVCEQCLHPRGEGGGPTAERPQRRQPAGATVCEQCLHPRQQSRQPANHRSAAKWVQKVSTARMFQWGTRNTKCTESCDKNGTGAETAMGSIIMRQDMNGGRVTSSHEMKMTMRQHEAKRNGQRARVGTRVKVRLVHKANTRKLTPMQQKNRVLS